MSDKPRTGWLKRDQFGRDAPSGARLRAYFEPVIEREPILDLLEVMTGEDDDAAIDAFRTAQAIVREYRSHER